MPVYILLYRECLLIDQITNWSRRSGACLKSTALEGYGGLKWRLPRMKYIEQSLSREVTPFYHSSNLYSMLYFSSLQFESKVFPSALPPRHMRPSEGLARLSELQFNFHRQSQLPLLPAAREWVIYSNMLQNDASAPPELLKILLYSVSILESCGWFSWSGMMQMRQLDY
jgi:hypothetical protein